MKARFRASLIVVLCLFFTRAGFAQNITGSTTLDIDPDSGVVTATCETQVDDIGSVYYKTFVSCNVYDGDGNPVGGASQLDSSRQGFAQAVYSFAGAPGTTYQAVGAHEAYTLVREVVTANPHLPPPPAQYIDEYNFSSFEGSTESFPNDYDWFGPGPEVYVALQEDLIKLGQTTQTGIRYYTPTEISQLITSAQSLFSPHCDAVFSSAIGSSYNNEAFFESLRATSFIQYPPGAANIPSHGSADAATEVNQPGRPIEFFPNFYPTKYGFEFPSFQQFVLIHEGVHHYTGWYDSAQDGSPNFVTQFGSYGYTNTTGTSNDFTVWLNAGCPPSS